MKRNHKKSNKVKKDRLLLVWHPGKSLSPYPQRFQTKFYLEGEYKVAIATASLTKGGVPACYPTNCLYPGGSSAFPSYTFLGPATEATLNPAGFSGLCNANLYQFGELLKSTIRVRLMPTTAANSCACTIMPGVGSAPSDIYTARLQPFAKNGSFNANKPNQNQDRQGWMSHSMTPQQFAGLSRLEAKADFASLSFAYNQAPSFGFSWYVYLQTETGDVTATTASLFQVRMEWDVVLFNSLQAALPVT